ncbi:unnamed protein product [Fraxinus pennsylvanica]|uniref:Protein kinase domain-containing protein n=1 Tax=Fraxinus pennsylvanica TaxID=56036 RepID=A0AAD1Z912_9LAMI|nr:unnamed protein product [Fraxinus pennsylvanica]
MSQSAIAASRIQHEVSSTTDLAGGDTGTEAEGVVMAEPLNVEVNQEVVIDTGTSETQQARPDAQNMKQHVVSRSSIEAKYRATTGLDLTTMAGGLTAAYYIDFVMNSSMVDNANPITVQFGPMNENTGARNAILNGLEVFRMNNSVSSLDGEYGVDGKSADGPSRGTVAAVGFAIMFGTFVGLGIIAVKWQKGPQDWQQNHSFSSWLLPLHAGDTSSMSNIKTSLGSCKSQFFSSTSKLGLYFYLAELQEATKNWDPNAIIGVGGFVNVYIGEINDGMKVAIKRGNPQSEQGINEFQTEIQMLSKLRHRHLVSLIGYCDENSEMILVYEYMSNSPFHDHIYGKDFPPLSWKQRLEICIEAACGLYYLHTGIA